MKPRFGTYQTLALLAPAWGAMMAAEFGHKLPGIIGNVAFWLLMPVAWPIFRDRLAACIWIAGWIYVACYALFPIHAEGVGFVWLLACVCVYIADRRAARSASSTANSTVPPTAAPRDSESAN